MQRHATYADRSSHRGEGSALDLHEEVSDPREAHPDPRGGGCSRWPENLRLQARRSDGSIERVVGRCGSPNQCGYCARLAAVENAELLALDAMQGDAPAVWLVLTTRQAIAEPDAFYRAREAVMRAIKRRWPAAQYACILEFTTGYGPKARGQRRPHWNVLIKGVPAAAVDELRDVAVKVWCGRRDVDALPAAQHVGTIAEAGGLMRYLALHFQKESQAPPAGWSGHRLTKSRGYLTVDERVVRESKAFNRKVAQLLERGDRNGEQVTIAEAQASAASSSRCAAARELARESLSFKRELRFARKGLGLHGAPAEAYAVQARELARSTSWEVVHSSAGLEATREAPRADEVGQLLAAGAWLMAAQLAGDDWKAARLDLGPAATAYVEVRRLEKRQLELGVNGPAAGVPDQSVPAGPVDEGDAGRGPVIDQLEHAGLAQSRVASREGAALQPADQLGPDVDQLGRPHEDHPSGPRMPAAGGGGSVLPDFAE